MNLSIYYFKAFLALLLIGFFAPSLMAQNGPTAQLQIIHNAPDPAVDTVDIYVNGEAFLSGVAFRQATAFTEVPAATDLDIQIAPAGAGIANAVGPFTYNLTEDEHYVLVASGVVDPDAFSGTTPSGFSLEVFAGAKTHADQAANVEINIHHGSPDAPAVDIYTNQTGDSPAVSDLAYPAFTGYTALSPDNEVVGIAGAGGQVLAEFSAPFADLNTAGAAMTVLASGFFDAANASEGNAFGLLAVLADGTVIELATPTSIDGFAENGIPEKFNLEQNYPNPFNPSTTISYSLAKPSYVTIDIFDVTGKRIKTLVNKEQSSGNYSVRFEASMLSSGKYFYRIQTEEFNKTRMMTLIK